MPRAVQGEEAHADYDDRDGDANRPTVISLSFLSVGELGHGGHRLRAAAAR
jgi:hypothetical protein